MWGRWRGSLAILLLVAAVGAMAAADAPAAADGPAPSSPDPASIAIAGLLAYNSTIGRAAKAALELAVRDVNNASVLGNDTQLVLNLGNTNCSAFQGAAAGEWIP